MRSFTTTIASRANFASCGCSDAAPSGVRGGGRRRGRKAGRGGLRDGHRRRTFEQPVVHLDDFPGGGQQAGNRRRRGQTMGTAMEQVGSEPLFQRPHPKRNRARRQAHAPGGSRKAPFPGDMQEGAQQPGVEVFHVYSIKEYHYSVNFLSIARTRWRVLPSDRGRCPRFPGPRPSRPHCRGRAVPEAGRISCPISAGGTAG